MPGLLFSCAGIDRARIRRKLILMSNFIGHCKCCKGSARITSEQAAPFSRHAMQAKYGRSGRVVRFFFAKCLCGTSVKFSQIDGIQTEHVCNAKCETSHGHVCECSCGGRNHGKAFATL